MFGSQANFTACTKQFNFNVSSYSEPYKEVILSCGNVTENLELDRSQLHIPYFVIEILVAILAVIGNFLVITVFLREKRLRRRTNYYIISLAFADFFVGILGIPFTILMSIGFIEYSNSCLLMMSLLLSFCTISVFSLVLISVDRFMAIVFPLRYSEVKKTEIVEIVICWILGASIGFLPFIWHRNLAIRRCFYHDVISDSYEMFRHVIVILIPTCIIFTIYGMIYKIVLHQLEHEHILNKSSCCCHREKIACVHRASRREIRITLNIFMIVVFFMVCWLPLNIVQVVKILCTTCNIPDNLIEYGIILTHFNSALNPFLYAYHLKEFRQSILVLMGIRQRKPSTGF